jgi:hypothetical protein
LSLVWVNTPGEQEFHNYLLVIIIDEWRKWGNKSRSKKDAAQKNDLNVQN